MSGHRPTRAEVATVSCPTCFAQARKPCTTMGDLPRGEHHIERVQRYRDGLFVPQPQVPALKPEKS